MVLQQTDALKYADKIYLTNVHYKGSLSAHYTGCQCAPVVEQKPDGGNVKNFERCVFQIEQVRSQQAGALWGEAAESAEYVMYGQTVKLKNVFSDRYLTIEKGSSENDGDAEGQRRMLASLRAAGAAAGDAPAQDLHKRQLFHVVSKMYNSGNRARVRLADQVYIESVTFAGLYVHATSLTTGLSVSWKTEESKAAPATQLLVDFQQRQKTTEWNVHAYETDKDRRQFPAEHCVMAGSAVILYHRDAAGFLLCERGVQGTEHIFLDKHNITKATYSVQDLPYGSNSLWVLESDDAKRGGPVLLKRYYRLKHLATGLYLTLSCSDHDDGYRRRVVTTTYRTEDENTLLAIVPRDATDSLDCPLTQSSFVYVYFPNEKVWLHATNDFSVTEPVPCVVPPDVLFKAASKGTTGKLQRVGTAAEAERYADVFAIRLVKPQEKESLTQVCSMVNTLERFHEFWVSVKKERDEGNRARRAAEEKQLLQQGMRKRATFASVGQQESRTLQEAREFAEAQMRKKLTNDTIEALKSLALFCTMHHVNEDEDPLSDHNGRPIHRHQSMLFQQNVHDLVFRVLKAPLEFGGLSLKEALEKSHLHRIFTLGYRLVQLMVKDAKDMAKLMDQFLPLFETQLGAMTMVADAYMQIISDNARLLAQLQRRQLRSFLWLIPEFGRKSTYMTLLSACCTYDGRGMAENQGVLYRELERMTEKKIGILHQLRITSDRSQGSIALIRPAGPFPADIDMRIESFKKRKEMNDDDASTEDDSLASESEEEEPWILPPDAARYAPRSRSMSPQAALLSVAYNVPLAMKGCWVHTCDSSAVVPRWRRNWFRAEGGCVSLQNQKDDVHSRTIPIYMFQRAVPDGVVARQPPAQYAKFGLTLLFKAPQGLPVDERRQRKTLLICAESMQDRRDLLDGLKREIKHSSSVDPTDLTLPDAHSNVSASLAHMRAQMNALRKRNATQERDDGDEGDGGGWMRLEDWVASADIEGVRYFTQSIHFLAQLCLGAKRETLEYVAKRFPFELIKAGMKLQGCDPIRSAFFRLARHMFIENDHMSIEAESKTVVKNIVHELISSNYQQLSTEPAKNELMTEVLTLTLGMITAGWYNEDDLSHLLCPLMKLLDGTNDAKPSKEKEKEQQRDGTAGKAAAPQKDAWCRFAWTESVQVVLDCKLRCCQVLRYLFNTHAADLKKWVQNNKSNADWQQLGRHGNATLNLPTDPLTQVLLDTSMYHGFPELFREALTLVLRTLGAGEDLEAGAEGADRVAINTLADLLRDDVLRENTELTVNLLRYFKESTEDALTIALLRVLYSMIMDAPMLNDPDATEVQKRKTMERMQNCLNALGVTPIMTQMIESNDEQVVAEALLVGQALLEGGNAHVQHATLHYFYSLNDEAFFMCTNNRLQKASALMKSTIQAAQQKDDALDTTSLASGRSDSDDPNQVYKDCNLHHLQQLLRFLQLFCEGHNRELQDYLRDQSDNVEKCNLVKETFKCLRWLMIVPNCDEFIYDHIIQAFNTLTEYCQGPCPDNQQALVHANITNEVNIALSRPFPLLSKDARDEIMDVALLTLLSVVEDVKERDTPRIICETLKTEHIKSLFESVWKRHCLSKEPKALDLGFTAFMLCKTLAAFDESISDMLETCDGFTYFTAWTGRIEIRRDESLVRVYFPIPRICSNLNKNQRLELLTNVDRRTATARIADFYERAVDLIYEFEFYERNFKVVRESHSLELFRQFKEYVNSNVHWLEDGMIVFAFLINGVICMNYVTDTSGDGGAVRKPFEGLHVESVVVRAVLTGLIAVQLVITVLLLFDFYMAKAPLIAHRKKKKQAGTRNVRTTFADADKLVEDYGNAAVAKTAGRHTANSRKPQQPVDEEKLQKNDPVWWETALASSGEIHCLFLIASVLFSVLGLLASPFWVSLHLVAIINRSDLLQNVIKAVTKNGRSLVLTLLLGIIVVYLFSVLGFILFRDAFKNDDCPDGESCEDHHCDELFRCFVYAVTSGIRQGGGIGDLMSPPQWSTPYNSMRMAFDFAFFIVVIVILLNIINGVIVDTFAELRSEKWKIEESIRSYCFICGIESSQFDRKAEGFEHHIKFDHNMWNYIYFIHHLRLKNPDEYNGQESYVSSMIEKHDYTNFFPLNKAVCLEGKQEDDDQLQELTTRHGDTQKRVEFVQNQLGTFQEEFTKEAQNMKEYLDGVTKRVMEATAERHAVLGELNQGERAP